MGLFLAMSGLAGASRPDVEKALEDFVRSKGGEFAPAGENDESHDVMVVSQAEDDRITVLYPGEFAVWDEASAYLSRSLNVPVFSFHIHDEDLWMYVLFAGGDEVDHFNPIPDYWSEKLSDKERQLWAGSAETIVRHWPGAKAADLEAYLVTWDLDEEDPDHAYADDEFSYLDCWQLTDFMRKLGLAYPVSDEGEALGPTYRFDVPGTA